MLEGIPLIYSSQEVAYPRSLNFFNYGVIDLKSNEVFAQEMAEIIRAYKATSSVRGGNWKFILPEMSLHFIGQQAVMACWSW